VAEALSLAWNSFLIHPGSRLTYLRTCHGGAARAVVTAHLASWRAHPKQNRAPHEGPPGVCLPSHFGRVVMVLRFEDAPEGKVGFEKLCLGLQATTGMLHAK